MFDCYSLWRAEKGLLLIVVFAIGKCCLLNFSSSATLTLISYNFFQLFYNRDHPFWSAIDNFGKRMFYNTHIQCVGFCYCNPVLTFIVMNASSGEGASIDCTVFAYRQKKNRLPRDKHSIVFSQYSNPKPFASQSPMQQQKKNITNHDHTNHQSN